MTSLKQAVQTWLDTASADAASNGNNAEKLQQLQKIIHRADQRQHLLYLHTRTPSVTASVIGMSHHEPVAGGTDSIRTRTDWPYETVHDAIIDGWQVVHFPNLMAPYDDRELNYTGYEFVLQKLEEIVEESNNE